jgi:opacity protein-like surface antigen
MKTIKKLLITATIISLAQFAASQEHFNEISINYGIATTDDVSTAFGNIFEDIVYDIFGDSTQHNNSSTGVFLLTYQHQFSKIISAGPVFGFELLETDVTYNDKTIGTIKHNSFTLGIEGRVDYLNREYFGMYLGLGVGATLIKVKSSSDDTDAADVDPNSHFNFHVTALGFRIGKQFGGIAELGYGYRGIANAGLFYRF